MPSAYLRELQSGLDPARRLYQIVEHGMCIGCGICQSIAGADDVTMTLMENGYLRPLVNGKLSCADMDRILDICPGTRVDGLPATEVDAGSLHDPVWGVWREIYYAYSAEPEVRHMASTGGLLTALALYLIGSGEVDFILHARAHEQLPTFGKRFISRSRADVLEAAGSRYGPTATLEDVVEIVDRAEDNNQTFAFIGTPCDISALRNYARHDPRVDRRCVYMLTMVCGGFMEPAGMKKFLKTLDVDIDHIKSLRYRGYGCPGPTTIETTDGRVIHKNYLEFWGEDDSAWQLPPRCKICPDGIGDAADIAAADTWDGGSPDWETQKTDPGFNAAIVRTRRGQALMDKAIAAGYLGGGEPLTPRDLDRFQPHQEKKKRSVWARFQGMRAAGNVVPDTTGLRLRQLSKQNPPGINAEQIRGARNRVEHGRFAEPTPAKPLPKQ